MKERVQYQNTDSFIKFCMRLYAESSDDSGGIGQTDIACMLHRKLSSATVSHWCMSISATSKLMYQCAV